MKRSLPEWCNFSESKPRVMSMIGDIEKEITSDLEQDNYSFAIDSLLTWYKTPQGADYWELRCYDRSLLTKTDISFIKRSYGIVETFNDDEWE